jgi:MFS family permease
MSPMASLKPTTLNRAPLMSERPIGAIHYRIIALCFAAWIFDFYDLILYSFLLLPIARDLHLSQTESSLTLGLALAMTAVGGVIFGFVGDRFGRKPTIIVCVLIYGVGTTLCAASHTLLQLLVFRSFTGIGIGGEWAGGQSLIAETVPPDRRARYAA